MTESKAMRPLRLIRMLLDGEWPAEEFLTLPAGQTIAGVYDWDRVVKANVS